jgi:hypothetical protein
MDLTIAIEGEQRKGVVAHTNDTMYSTPSAASALSGLAGGSSGAVRTGKDRRGPARTSHALRTYRVMAERPREPASYWQGAQENAQGHPGCAQKTR